MSFLKAYEDYYTSATDGPLDFAEVGGLMCLAGVAAGRRWIERSKAIHPNLFVVFIGPPASDRKSHSVNLAIDILKDVEEERVGPTDFTPEGLLHIMQKKVGEEPRTKIVLPKSEFGQFLATMQRSYASNLPGLLCELYDCQDFEYARAGGKNNFNIIRPIVSLFGGCSYGMLEKYAEPLDWATGLYSRILFMAATRRRTRIALMPMAQRQARELATARLVEVVQAIGTTTKAMEISPEALKILISFEEKFSVIREDENDLALVAQRERLVNSAWKISMLYQIDSDPYAPIGAEAMARACAIVPLFWNSFRTVYGLCGGEAFSRMYLKVWQRITEAGEHGIKKRDLSRTFFRGGKDYMAAFEHLVKSDMVRVTAGRPAMVYVLEPCPEPIRRGSIQAAPDEDLGTGAGEPN
jgi:hypothetical protein